MAGIQHFNDPTAFNKYSKDMNDVFINIDDYNTGRRRRVLIVFDVMIADIMSDRKFKAIIKELFIRSRKLNISIVFITQSYFRMPKDARLNSTHYLLMKIYKNCMSKPYSFMIIDTTLPGGHPMRFRRNFL